MTGASAGDTGVGGREPSCEPLIVGVRVDERGYRRVLLHLAALRLRFVPPLLGLLAFSAYAAGARTEAATLFLGALAIPIVLWGYLAWLSKSPRSRSVYAPVRYEFTDAAIAYRASESEGIIPWDQVVRWREAADHLLVYVSSSSYLLVPLADLESGVQARLRQILTEHVAPLNRRARRIR